MRGKGGIECSAIALAILFSGIGASVLGLAEDTDCGGADLAVLDISWCDMFGSADSAAPEITSGQPYDVSASVGNIGTDNAGDVTVTLSIDGVQTGDAVVLDCIGAGSEATVCWTEVVTSEAGPHQASVAASLACTCGETDLDNNVLSEGFAVVEAEWTFAVYMDGDNNLENMAFLDFIEMATVGTTPEVNIAVQFDRAEGYYSDYGDWTDAKRFLVTQGMEPWAESAYEDLGEVNMGDQQTLADFAAHAFDRFRASKTCLVLWDHGASWYGGCCADETSLGDSLGTDEMRGALQYATEMVGSPVDIVAFDACVMASLEVAYAFEGLAVDFVASESIVPAYGYPYDAILGQLTTVPSIEADMLCEAMVSEYALEYAGSSINILSAFRVDTLCVDVADALSRFADSLIAFEGQADGRIAAARCNVEGFDVILTSNCYMDSYSADLYTFAREVASRINDDAAVAPSAEALMTAIEDARFAVGLVAEYEPYSDIFGLMIFWPEVPVFLEEYKAERLSLDTTWDELLLAFYSK